MSSDEDLPPPPQMEKSSATSTARSLPPEQPPTPATPAATATPPAPEAAADKEEAAATGVPALTSSFLNHVSLCFCIIVESLAGGKAVHGPDRPVLNFRVFRCSHLCWSY